MPSVLFASVMLAFPNFGLYTRGIEFSHWRAHENSSEHSSVKSKKTSPKRFTGILETLTIYHPSASQCDSSPLITASNARIDTLKLRGQKLRWMALSRDMLKKWKGYFAFGDTVRLVSGDPAIDGMWIIQDVLNKRYSRRGDLLFDRKVRAGGKWNNVRISTW